MTKSIMYRQSLLFEIIVPKTGSRIEKFSARSFLTKMATFQTSASATVPVAQIDSKHEDMIHDSQFDYYGIYF